MSGSFCAWRTSTSSSRCENSKRSVLQTANSQPNRQKMTAKVSESHLDDSIFRSSVSADFSESLLQHCQHSQLGSLFSGQRYVLFHNNLELKKS